MRLEGLSFLCLTFLTQYVSSQSHTVVTLIATDSVFGPETDIFTIDSGGPTQTVHGEQIQGVNTITISAIVAANTLELEEFLTNNGTTDSLDLQCSIHDVSQGDCSEIIEAFNSVKTVVTTTTFTTIFPSEGLFPTVGSNSSSQSTPASGPPSSSAPAPASPSSSPTSSSSPAAPTPSPDTSSPSPTTTSSVSPPPATNPASSSVTPSPTSPTTTPTTSSTTNLTSPTTSSSNSTDTQLPANNSRSSLKSSLFFPVLILMATRVLSVVVA